MTRDELFAQLDLAIIAKLTEISGVSPVTLEYPEGSEEIHATVGTEVFVYSIGSDDDVYNFVSTARPNYSIVFGFTEEMLSILTQINEIDFPNLKN